MSSSKLSEEEEDEKKQVQLPKIIFFLFILVDILYFMLSMLVVIHNVFESLISINQMRFTHIMVGVDLMKTIRFLKGYLGDVLSSRLDGHTQTDVDMNKLNENEKKQLTTPNLWLKSNK